MDDDAAEALLLRTTEELADGEPEKRGDLDVDSLLEGDGVELAQGETLAEADDERQGLDDMVAVRDGEMDGVAVPHEVAAVEPVGTVDGERVMDEDMLPLLERDADSDDAVEALGASDTLDTSEVLPESEPDSVDESDALDDGDTVRVWAGVRVSLTESVAVGQWESVGETESVTTTTVPDADKEGDALTDTDAEALSDWDALSVVAKLTLGLLEVTAVGLAEGDELSDAEVRRDADGTSDRVTETLGEDD